MSAFFDCLKLKFGKTLYYGLFTIVLHYTNVYLC